MEIELHPRAHKIKLAYLRSGCDIPVTRYADPTSYSYIGLHGKDDSYNYVKAYPTIKKIPT